MLTIPQIQEHQSRPNPPDYFPFDASKACNYCLHCGTLLQHPPLEAVPSLDLQDCDTCGLYHVQYVCPLKSPGLRAHERICMECSQILAAIWHYQGRQYTLAPTVHLDGAALDVYVWLLCHQLLHASTPGAAATIAAELGYTRSKIQRTLTELVCSGLLLREKHGRQNRYRPLISQKPKGY